MEYTDYYQEKQIYQFMQKSGDQEN